MPQFGRRRSRSVHAGFLALVVTLGCGRGTTGGQGGGSGGKGGGSNNTGGSAGSGNASGKGVRVPDITVDPGDGENPGLDVRDSTLDVDPDQQLLLWLFTIENTSDTPLCNDRIAARLYDASGAILAGSPLGSPFLDATTPGFSATVTGKPYYVDGSPLLDCVPPGERGIGQGAVIAQAAPLTTDDLRSMLERAARLEYSVAPRSSAGGIELATDLISLEDVALSETASGKVVSGTVKGGAPFTSFRVDVALFDDRGQLVDFVSAFGAGLGDGGSAEFETTAGSAAATRFEAFVGGQLGQ